MAKCPECDSKISSMPSNVIECPGCGCKLKADKFFSALVSAIVGLSIGLSCQWLVDSGGSLLAIVVFFVCFFLVSTILTNPNLNLVRLIKDE